ASIRLRPQVEREMRPIWDSLFSPASAEGRHVILISAARRQAGVTEIAAALALTGAAAHPDLRVALIEANVRHPRLAAALRLDTAGGAIEGPGAPLISVPVI